MAAKEFYCTACQCWVKKQIDEPTRGARRKHEKLCNGDPIANHPDLINLDAELEYFFGST